MFTGNNRFKLNVVLITNILGLMKRGLFMQSIIVALLYFMSYTDCGHTC